MSVSSGQTSNESSLLTRLFKSKPKKETPEYAQVPPGVTLYHVTHWKAGSQWMRGILRDLYGPATVEPDNFETQLLSHPVLQDKVYLCAYLSKPEFDAFTSPGASRKFVLIRDLRDTLVSGYFSVRSTHVIDNPIMEKWRTVLTKLNEEQGLLYLTEVWLPQSAIIQRTWLESGERVFRLEDCMTDSMPIVTAMFEQGWGVQVKADRLREVVSKHAFEKLSGGREPGKEDANSHYRKGVHGDWQNHFTPAVKRRFKALYNDLLVMGGYEKNEGW